MKQGLLCDRKVKGVTNVMAVATGNYWIRGLKRKKVKFQQNNLILKKIEKGGQQTENQLKSKQRDFIFSEVSLCFMQKSCRKNCCRCST